MQSSSEDQLSRANMGDLPSFSYLERYRKTGPLTSSLVFVVAIVCTHLETCWFAIPLPEICSLSLNSEFLMKVLFRNSCNICILYVNLKSSSLMNEKSLWQGVHLPDFLSSSQ